MMVPILSLKISSSDQMRALVELSNMTDDPSDSNPKFSEDSTLEESIWHILYFEIVQKTKGLFLVWPLGGLFLAFQMGLL